VSIYAYTGLPGSGKSYSVVQHQVLPALREGRTVVTNLPLKRDLVLEETRADAGCLREFPAELVAADPETIFEHFPEGSVLILDEVWKLFPSGLKTNNVPNAFKTAFAEHRHRVDAGGRSCQIVLVTQDLAQIAMFARQLVEQTFRTTKLTTVGFDKRFRVDVYAGPVAGPNPPVNSAIRQIFGKYDKRIFRLYTSHTQSLAAEDGADEKSVDRRGNVLLRPVMLAAPFLVLGLLWFGFTHLHKPRNREEGTATGANPRAIGAGIAPLAAPPSGSFLERVTPRHWRVSGVISGLGGTLGDIAIVTDDERSLLVDLAMCRRTRFDLYCPTETGELVSMRSSVRARGSGPLGKPSVGSTEIGQGSSSSLAGAGLAGP